MPPVDEGPIDGAAPGFRSPLSHREFRWFVTHHLLAGTGSIPGDRGGRHRLFDQTGSATWVGLAAAARLLPYLVCSGPAGVLVDRIDRRRLLLGSAVAGPL